MEIKPFQINNEVEIARLFNLAFQRSLTSEYWNWRFANNPFQKEPMISLMWEDTKLIGHHAVSASEIFYKGQTLKFCLCGTAMTHPDYEFKGIYGKLANNLYERIAKDYNVSAIITFPNRAASHYSLVKKIGYKNVGYLPTLRKKNNYIEALEVAEINTIFKFDAEHCEFISQTVLYLGFDIYVNRSERYLNWRYIDNPNNNYHIIEYREEGSLKGLLIAKIYQEDIFKREVDIDIVDLFCTEDFNIISKLLQGITNVVLKLGYTVNNLNCWISLFDRRHLELEKIGFTMCSPITYFCIKSLGSELPDINQFEKWYISMGDSDIF